MRSRSLTDDVAGPRLQPLGAPFVACEPLEYIVRPEGGAPECTVAELLDDNGHEDWATLLGWYRELAALDIGDTVHLSGVLSVTRCA